MTKTDRSFKNISATEALADIDGLIMNMDIEAYRNKKRPSKKSINLELSEALPTFEKCLLKLCKNMSQCYNLETHQCFQPNRKCDKLLSFQAKEAIAPQPKFNSELSKRELSFLFMLVTDAIAKYQQLGNKEVKLDYLADKLGNMAKQASGVKVSALSVET
jgi:hypothetical protein